MTKNQAFAQKLSTSAGAYARTEEALRDLRGGRGTPGTEVIRAAREAVRSEQHQASDAASAVGVVPRLPANEIELEFKAHKAHEAAFYSPLRVDTEKRKATT